MKTTNEIAKEWRDAYTEALQTCPPEYLVAVSALAFKGQALITESYFLGLYKAESLAQSAIKESTNGR
jgi:hypothetical protein